MVWDGTTTFTVDLNGTTAGSDYDQLNVVGGVTLGGATLNLVPTLTPAANATFTVVNNDGTDAVTGTFKDTLGNSLIQGSVFAVDGRRFQISYTGGDGNDVVLTYLDTVTAAFADSLRFRASHR